MNPVSACIICAILSALNLPFVLQEGGSTINLISMIICAAFALDLARRANKAKLSNREGE